MHKHLLILSILLFSFAYCSKSQDHKHTENIHKITFNVDTVDIAETLITEVPYRNAIEYRISGIIEAYDNDSENNTLIQTNNNAFLTAVHYAYADHRPLTISPDMIWLLIEQGFAFHINQNAESLRSMLVDFEGKKTIKVKNYDFQKGNIYNDWKKEISTFSDSIRSYIGEELYSVLIPEFTTSNINTQTAFEITMMDAFEVFFEYLEETECGFPEITLEGTTNDWEKIKQNTVYLEKYNLEWWTNKLLPVLDQFIETSKGNIDKNFWKKMYKVKSTYNSAEINGWICYFFPYINPGFRIMKNPIFENKKYLSADCIPQGISKAPFTWIHIPDTSIYIMEFYAGFTGIKQDTVTKNLRPEISWAVRDVNDSTWTNCYESKFYGSDIFIYTKNMPEFPGGQLALREYIKNNIKYPNTEEEGTVYIRFEVKKDGTIGEIKILKRVSELLDNEAVRVIKTLPKFKPGSQNGKKVNVWYSIPVTFRFNELE